MKDILVYPLGQKASNRFAAGFLAEAGVALVDHPTPEVSHLLLDVPSQGPEAWEPVLRMLPGDVVIAGGNLPPLPGHQVLDLLKDPGYLAANAYITAECALQVAAENMDGIFRDTPVLIIGWGRIGKCLAKLLQALGARVTVAARKERDRALLAALGYETVSIDQMAQTLPGYRLLFNTAPEPVLSAEQLKYCRDCLKIELASRPGLEGSDVLQARGLPGIYAPKASGALIGNRFLQLYKEGKK